MRYFATSMAKSVIEHYRSGRLGLLNTPASSYDLKALGPNLVWAADNGCFSDNWNEDKWLRWLESCIPYQSQCAWAVVPDVVGDHAATVERFHKYAPTVRAMGYRLAFVGQNGATVEFTPWDEFDCWFAGGDTAWKLGDAWAIHAEAKRRGKVTHMGRVNSKRRFMAARSAGYDSVDGTFLAFGPDINIGRLLAWVDAPQEQVVLW